MLVIGQCNRTVKGTVNTTCLCSVQCARVVDSHFAELTLVFLFCFFCFVLFCLFYFFMKTNNRCLVSFSNFVLVLINFDFVITRMITDRIGLHSVLLPL